MPFENNAAIELEEVFGEIKNGKDRHRVSERLSKFNSLGRPYGVRLELVRSERKILIHHTDMGQLRKFQSKLSHGTGALQRAMAQALGQRLPENPETHTEGLRDFIRRELQKLPASIAKPLQFSLGISIDSLFIPPSCYGFLRKSLLAPKPFHGLVTGEPGSGKTTLLYMLFQELSRLYLAGEISSLPVFIPAIHAEIRNDRLFWWMGNLDYQRFLKYGVKKIFLIDGLDENPELLEGRIETLRAWQEIFQNSCLISCRNRFYSEHLEDSGFENKLNVRWLRTHLTEWNSEQTRTLFRRLADSSMTLPPETRMSSSRLKEIFAHLSGLSEQGIAAGAVPFRKTPLNLWLYSLFVAYNRGFLPKNEYELLEFIFTSICQWQAAKKGRLVPPKAISGILTRIAWQSYERSQGRDQRFIPYSELKRVLDVHWPGLWPRTDQVMAELEANPILERDPMGAVLRIDPHFRDFLAARHLIQTTLLQDIAEACRQWSQPVLWDVSRYFDEGLDQLPASERRLAATTLIAVFEECERALEKDGSFSAALALNQTGYHLGKMGSCESREFLHRVLKKRGPALKVEICYWAIVIGLALSGDKTPLARYVERLEKNPESARLNLAYCQLYYLDRKAPSGRFDTSLGNLEPVWEKSCDGILNQLSSPEFRNIRLLDLFCFRRFLETLGPAPFLSDRGGPRKEKIRFILNKLTEEGRVDRRLAAQCQRLKKTLSQHALVI